MMSQPLAPSLQLKARSYVCSLIQALDQQHLVFVVYLMELHFNDLAAAGGHTFADVRGLDGQFAMAAVNEHGQLHAARTAVVEERVERGPDRPAGVEHIVAKHYVAAVDFNADGPWRDYRTHAGCGQIVAVELNIEQARIDRMLLDAGNESAQPLGQRNAAALDAYQRQVFAAIALFNNLVG